jgi:hypothetical protein
MTTASIADPSIRPDKSLKGASKAFPILVGLTSLGILVQSLMAGVFLQSDGERDSYATWITAHGVGADVTTVLAIAATIAAFVGFRSRKSLAIASGGLVVLLLVESLLGHLINGSIGGSDHDKLTIVHIPLGMALLGLAVYLSFQAAHLRRSANSN